jgi:methionine-rich copper-binding protein CopC
VELTYTATGRGVVVGTMWSGRGLAAAMVAAGLLLAFPLRAEAHARIAAVAPAPSSTVSGPLSQVVLTFNEPVDQSRFRLTIVGDGVPELAGRPTTQDVVQPGLFGSRCQ